ncbi:MAG: response regulator [Chitinivibrionales bacterium]|nr:response regulator [Chitinivibrionales bacterium]
MNPSDRIIIVEDEKDIRELLLTVLENDGYSEIAVFENPIKALQHIHNGWVPDLFITNYNLEQMKGDKVLEAARKIYPELRGLIITGDPLSVSEATGDFLIIDKGDLEFLEKLLQAIRSNITTHVMQGKPDDPRVS